MKSSINQSLLCGNSPSIEFLNKGQGFIVIESDPGAIDKGIQLVKYNTVVSY